MKLTKVLLAWLIVLTLTACGTHVLSPDEVQARYDTWIGHTRDELVLAWGAPSKTTRLSDGSNLEDFVCENAYSTLNGAAWINTCHISVITEQSTNLIIGIKVGNENECAAPTTLSIFPLPE